MVGSLTCILLLGEGALRLVGAGRFGLQSWHTSFLHRPDPELIFSMRPDADVVWRMPEFVEKVRTNSLGLRGPEPRSPAPPRRIVVLGDSMTFGHGVRDSQTYSKFLEALFAISGEEVEVVNAGVKGYGTDQSFKLYLTRLRHLRPDLVIFGHYRNDIADNVHQSLYGIEAGQLVPMDPTRNTLYRVGVIHEWIPAPLLRLRLTRVAIVALLGYVGDEVGPETHAGDPTRWSRSKVLLELKQLHRIVQADGGRLLVLGVPSRDGPRSEYDWLRELDRVGIPFFDPRARSRWKSEGLFYEKDDHFTAAGHERLARELYRYTVAAKLLDALAIRPSRAR